MNRLPTKLDGLPGHEQLSSPGSWINELAFRTMWSEFEWENKVNINTSITEAQIKIFGMYFIQLHHAWYGVTSKWTNLQRKFYKEM